MELHELEITEVATLLRKRKVSPTELLAHTRARIEQWNPILNAYLSLREHAARDAERAERALRSRRPAHVLCGVPISIKDLILSSDQLTTAGSRCFGDGMRSDHDAPVIRRLRRAGAVIVGRVNLHEVALGVTSVNEHFGPARNPWNTSHVAGGSSGGSAVAVVAGLGAASVGTDTRGSIRIPAACCGAVGLKPTRGLVSTADVIPLSPTLDTVGPITRSVTDAAAMLGGMAGTEEQAARWLRATRKRSSSLRIAISEYHLRDLDSEVQRAIDGALRVLRKVTRKVGQVRIAGIDAVQAASVVITASEAFKYHQATLQQDPSAFGPLVRQRLEGGSAWRAVDYLNALETRRQFESSMSAVFQDVDVLIGATIPALPPLIGAHAVQINGADAHTVDAFTRANSPQNMAGTPALSVPVGFSESGLPLAMQLLAGHGKEEHLFTIGSAFQRETDWHRRRPPLR
ncbi:MAG: amidase [Gemmatimonadaceae bacterium]